MSFMYFLAAFCRIRFYCITVPVCDPVHNIIIIIIIIRIRIIIIIIMSLFSEDNIFSIQY